MADSLLVLVPHKALHGTISILIQCRLSRAAICACLATGVCVGSVTLELWVMRGTCSWSALLLQISETSTLHCLQSAQVSWLGLCGPETSPWSAGTSLLASIECHADDRQTLFHPFSLVGCQGCCKLSFHSSNAHFQGTAADAIPHGVSCLAGGTG